MANGAELLVAALENEGVERVFGVPGEENLAVLEALRRSGRVELVLTRNEQPAAFMAATHGRLTGQPGVCISTLGPGALNLATGAAYAHLGAMPMVLVAVAVFLVGMGQPMDEVPPMVAPTIPTMVWGGQLRLMARALGVKLDDLLHRRGPAAHERCADAAGGALHRRCGAPAARPGGDHPGLVRRREHPALVPEHRWSEHPRTGHRQLPHLHG